MKTHYLTASALCLAAIWMTAPADAQIIIESSTAGVLLSDNFENDTVGQPPSDPPWTIQEGTPVVQDEASAGVPPSSGTKFVELEADDTMGVNFSGLSTGTLTTSFAFWMVDGTGADGPSRFRVRWFESDLTNVVGQIGFAPDTKTVEGTSLTFNTDEWTYVTLVVDLDAPATTALAVTVNGESATAPMLNTNDIYGVTILSRGSGGPDVYIDAIPEPSSFSLLAAGLVGGLLLLRRRRCSGC